MKTKERKELLKRFNKQQLLDAVAVLEEVVKTKVPDEWEVEKAKEKIRKLLLENGGELSRSRLYKAVHGERMGVSTFNGAILSLEEAKEIVIFKNKSKFRPLETIRLLRSESQPELSTV